MSKKEKDNKHESAELQPQRQEITPIETRELEVSPEAAEVLRELPEKKRDVIISEIIRYEQQSFSGPVPHPDHLAGYEKTLPGAADRILIMAEKEQEHRHEMEKDLLKTKRKQHTRGQNIGCGLAIVLAAFASVLGFLGHDWLSGAIFTTTIISVIIVYVLEKRPKMGTTTKPKDDDI